MCLHWTYPSSHPLFHKETSTTCKACFDFKICSYLFLQSRKPSHCTPGSPWQGQILTFRLDPLRDEMSFSASAMFFCVSFRYCTGWLWKGDGIYFLHHKAPIVQDIQETWKNEGPSERKYQEEKDLKYAILHILRSSKTNSVWFVHQFLPSHGCPEYYRFYPVTITSNYVFQEQKDI